MSTLQASTLPTPAPKQPYNRWTENEIAVLRQYYASHGPTYIAGLLPARTKDQCSSKAKSLGLVHGAPGADWTATQTALLVEHYPTQGAQAVAALVGHSPMAVRKMANRLQVRCRKPGRGDAWREEDYVLLREHYPAGMPVHRLASLLGRQRSKIMSMVGKLGLRRPGMPPRNSPRKGTSCSTRQVWTPAEDAVLLQLWPTATRAELLAALPGRHAQSIWARATRVLELGARPRSGGWTEAEQQIVRDQYPLHGAEHVAALVGRSAHTVMQKAMTLGVKRSRVAFAQAAKDRPDAWTPEQEELLRQHYPAWMPIRELAALVGHSVAATQHRLAYRKIHRDPLRKPAPPVPAPKPVKERKAPGRPARRTAQPVAAKPAPRPKAIPAPKVAPVAKVATPRLGWTPEADAQLVALFPDMDTEAVAEQLGRKLHPVKVRAQDLKLKKSDAYLAVREAAQAQARLIRKKGQAQAEKKKNGKGQPSGGAKKWYQYHMSTPEYKAGLAATTAGLVPVSGIDESGRPTTFWRKPDAVSHTSKAA